MKKKIPFYLFLLFNVLAFVDSLYLTFHHYKINILLPSESSFCNINSLLDCDSVALGKFSTLFGIPVSTFGIFAYSFIFLLLLFFLVNKKDRIKEYFSFSLYVLVVMLLFSIYEFAMAVFVLNKLCIMCLGLYISVFMMVIFAKLLTEKSFKKSFLEFIGFMKNIFSFHPERGFLIPAVVNLLFAIIISFASDIFIRGHYDIISIEDARSKRYQQELVNHASRQIDLFKRFQKDTKNNLDLKNIPFKGNKNAKAILIEFSDFECSACQSRAAQLTTLLAKVKDKLVIYFKNYPLDQNCNRDIDRKFHENACVVAEYSYCASKENKFWKFHDDIFNLGRTIDEDYMLELADKFKLDKKSLKNCVKTTGKKEIKKQVEEAIKLKVEYTPTLFLNGVKISDYVKSMDDLEFIINKINE